MNAVLQACNHEVWLVTTVSDGLRSGLTATTIHSVSIAPDLPRLMVGLAKQHLTTALLDARGAFALHLLAEDQAELAWRFGLESGRSHDKFAGLACTETPLGNPRLTDVATWLDCRVEARFDIGDRLLFIGEIVDGARLDRRPPLTMQRLLASASPQQLERLKQVTALDAAHGAPLIRAWRHRQNLQQQEQQQQQ